jgi:hypothetical protein
MCSLSIRTDFTRRRPNGTFKSSFAGVYESIEPPNNCIPDKKTQFNLKKRKEK